MTSTTGTTKEKLVFHVGMTHEGQPAPIRGATIESLDSDSDDSTATIVGMDADAGKFDVELTPGTLQDNTPKLRNFKLKVQRDLDNSGDTDLEEDIAYTVVSVEASQINLGQVERRPLDETQPSE